MTACSPWQGSIDRDGYGRVGGGRLAHRVEYEKAKGPIPTGLTLDHLCRVRSCVNPDHLEPVTRTENILRGVSGPAQNARKTECIRGHALDSICRRRNGQTFRRCLTCHREDERRRRDETGRLA